MKVIGEKTEARPPRSPFLSCRKGGRSLQKRAQKSPRGRARGGGRRALKRGQKRRRNLGRNQWMYIETTRVRAMS